MNSSIPSAIIRKILKIFGLIPIVVLFLVSLNASSAKPDTTCSASFQLNMTKAVSGHIFDPDSDYVSLVMDHGIQPIRLLPGPGLIYSVTLSDQLDSGTIYHYKFAINNSLLETVNRSFTAQPGMVSMTAWWNNESLNITTFVVNMKYAVQYLMFNPLTDSVCVVGTMNDWMGSPKMGRIDTTLNYQYTDYQLDPGTIQEYKYRINLGDTASGQSELLYRPNRIIRIPDTVVTITNDYNNYNPAKRLMTFNCDMGYSVKAHHFNLSNDYLDIAGNFNDGGANDVLFDTDDDTIYAVELFIDTNWFHQEPLAFKFRINGDPNAAELQGKPARIYAFHDTIQQNPNIFSCYYNNLDPSVPTPPWVYNVDIQGLLIHKKFLCGVYAYEDVNGIPEGISSYRWLRSNNAQGLDAVAIDSGLKITYTVDTLDIGKWLVFEVTPKAASGDSAIGKPVRVVSASSISAWDVGIGEYSLITRVYPNPASDYITVQAKREIARIELINYLNQAVLVKEDLDAATVSLPLGNLPKGIYILKASTKSREWGVVRVMKY